MEWWAYLICGVVIWLFGFIGGRAAGQAQALTQIMGVSAGKMPGLPGLPGLPGDMGRGQ